MNKCRANVSEVIESDEISRGMGHLVKDNLLDPHGFTAATHPIFETRDLYASRLADSARGQNPSSSRRS